MILDSQLLDETFDFDGTTTPTFETNVVSFGGDMGAGGLLIPLVVEVVETLAGGEAGADFNFHLIEGADPVAVSSDPVVVGRGTMKAGYRLFDGAVRVHASTAMIRIMCTNNATPWTAGQVAVRMGNVELAQWFKHNP